MVARPARFVVMCLSRQVGCALAKRWRALSAQPRISVDADGPTRRRSAAPAWDFACWRDRSHHRRHCLGLPDPAHLIRFARAMRMRPGHAVMIGAWRSTFTVRACGVRASDQCHDVHDARGLIADD